MLSARRQFLDAFLGALGAAEIVDYLESGSQVSGTVRYAQDSELIDLSGHAEDEFQDFVWRVSEEGAPPLLVYRIADVLHRYHLLDVDRLRVSRDTLLGVLSNDGGEPVPRVDFDAALDALKSIAVLMVEDGGETGDAFFIHE